MSAPEAAEKIAEVAADGVADGMHVVSEEALAVEEAVRGLNEVQLAWLGIGLATGAAIGSFVAYRIVYRKAETKYSQLAAEEIAEMREHYRQKAVALEAAQDKGNLEDIVRERGYAPRDGEVEEEESEAEAATTPPMAVTPPAAVSDRAAEIAEAEDEAAGEPPDDEEFEDTPEPVTRNVFQDNAPPEDHWDWAKERASRSPLRPYVIHREERDEHDAYDNVTFTYYEADDVVCNERDEVITEEDRERIFGEAALEKFGHGSGDATTVYVRNNKLEMDIEIIRSLNSYAEEVHGLEPEIQHSARRRERRSIENE